MPVEQVIGEGDVHSVPPLPRPGLVASHKQDGYASVTVGNQGALSLEGAANLPLSGDWAARISAQSQRRSDWVDNIADPGSNDLEGYSDIALRGQLQFAPSEDIKLRVTGQYRDFKGTARVFRAARQDGRIPRLVPRAAPATAGVSGCPDVLEARIAAGQLGVAHMVALQKHYNLVHRDEYEGDLARVAAQLDVGVLPRLPRASQTAITNSRSSGVASFDVACRAIASGSSSRSMPAPLSRTYSFP